MAAIITRRGFLSTATAGAAMAGLPTLASAEDTISFRWFKNPTENFTTGAVWPNLALSNLPINPVFHKLYQDTYVKVMLALDVEVPAGETACNFITQDGIGRLQVSIASVGDTVVVDMGDVFSAVPKGDSSWPILVGLARAGKPATWLTPFAAYKAWEVSMPPVDYSEYRERWRDEVKRVHHERLLAAAANRARLA